MQNSKTTYTFLLGILFFTFLLPASYDAEGVVVYKEKVICSDSTGQRKKDFQETVAADSVQSDSTRSDSLKENAPFEDIIYFESADSIKLKIQSKEIYMHKEAKVKYQKTELTADHITMNMGDNTAFAKGVLADTLNNVFSGEPHFKDGKEEFDSKSLKYNFETGKGLVNDIITKEDDGYIQGKITKKMNDSVYCVKHGKYTTCDQHDHPHFYINMREAKYIKDDKVVSKFVNLVIADVPLPIALPFGFFPITKKGTSGIIMPTYGEEKMRGFSLKDGGYYWAMSQYMDLSVLGTIYTNGSWAMDLSSNYRKRYRFNGGFKFGYSKNKYGEKTDPDYRKSTSWSVNWRHAQDPKANPYSTFSASVDISSANNNYYNSTSITDIANQRKSSSISYSRRWPDSPFSMSLALNHSQNSRDSTISLTLPNLNFKISQVYPFRKKNKVGEYKWYDNIGFNYTLESRNFINTKENQLGESFRNIPRDWQNGFKHNIPLSISIKPFANFSISPSFSYSGIGVLKTIRKSWVSDTSDRSGGHVKIDTIVGFKYGHNYSGSISASYNPKIYGIFSNTKTDGKFIALRHVISPSLSASYTPKMGVKRSKYWHKYYNPVSDREVEYSIFEGQPYSVGSSSEENASIHFSIDNNLEMKMRNDADTTGENPVKKVKILESLKASCSYNVFADSMNFSNITLSARTTLFGKMNINVNGTIDPYKMTKNATRINKYSGKLGRLTRISATTSFSFSGDQGQKKEEKDELVNGHYEDYMDFEVPWNLSVDYSFSLNKIYRANDDPQATGPIVKSNISQIFNVTGDLSLTEKWKVGFSSGFDISNKEVTTTSFNISRNLHCWDMSLNCIPFGTHRSYNFKLSVTSSLLKDLKLTKRDSWYDNTY